MIFRAKHLFFFLILLVTFQLFGQVRIAIAGTRLSIVPPTKNAKISNYYSVISEDDSYEMSVVEFPESNLQEKMNEIDSIAYTKRGLEVIGEFEMEVDHFKAKVIHVKSNLYADGVQVLFGDSTFFVMVSTLFTKGDKVLFNSILDSYRTLKIDRSKKINWNKFLAFEQKSANQFKLVEKGCFPMKMVFSKNAMKQDSVFSDSFIWVQQVPNDGNLKTNQELMTYFLMSALSSDKIEILKVIHDGVSTISGVETYQFIAECRMKTKNFQLNAIGYLNKNCGIFFQSFTFNEADTIETERFFKNLKFK